ncbi:MAG: aminopeptidase P N-terminal domain-containing protein, partial [Bacteroidetes bacterium]|nr:aminopeptidase P N-terminal domain-containing protein [Bacteroidota bacterium]
MFSAQTYTDRRNQLMQKIDSGIILLLGNEESGMNYADNTYHFRQDSNFLYYCGLDTASLAAVIDVDAGTTTIFGDELSIDMIVWTGPLPTIKERALKAGIHQTAPYAQLDQAIKEAKNKGRTIHYLPPYRPENAIKLHYFLDYSLAEVERNHSVELIKAIVSQRSIKTEEEITEIEKGVAITNEMHLTAMRMARPGMTEAEIVAAVLAVPHKHDSHLSFPIICSIHGETLHNHYHHNTLESGKLLLLDAGGESTMHYAGDMTRTFPVDPTFTEKQKDVYNIVLKALNTSIDLVKPGVTYRMVHLEAAKVIASGLKDLGLMKGDLEEAVAAGAHALFFPHGLGHMMGLDVHDMEDLGEQYVGYTDTMAKSTQFGLKSLRLGRELKPGFVLTIEP